MNERISDIDNVKDMLVKAREINDDGYATGLQPYEIRALLDLLDTCVIFDKPQKANMRRVLGKMPYLPAATHSVAFTDADAFTSMLEVFAGVILNVGHESARRREELSQIRADVRGMQRLFGIEAAGS